MHKPPVKQDNLINVSLSLVFLVGWITEDTSWRGLSLAAIVLLTRLIIHDDFRANAIKSFNKGVNSAIEFFNPHLSKTDRN
jgi:hypothetical protein